MPPVMRRYRRCKSVGLAVLCSDVRCRLLAAPAHHCRSAALGGNASGDRADLTDTPIEPPYLTDLDATMARSVAMRLAGVAVGADRRAKSANCAHTGAGCSGQAQDRCRDDSQRPMGVPADKIAKRWKRRYLYISRLHRR